MENGLHGQAVKLSKSNQELMASSVEDIVKTLGATSIYDGWEMGCIHHIVHGGAPRSIPEIFVLGLTFY
jgi:hypothetical protein